MTEAFFTVDLREEGVLLARARFLYPKENALFSELAERTAAWFRGSFSAYAREVYAKDQSPKKHFRFPRFDYTFSAREKDKGVLFSVTLAREGATLSHHEEHLFFRQALLAPPPRKRKKEREW